MVKAYLSGAGATFSTSDGTKYSNKEQVAQYCSKIWDKVEFVKSESPACDFVVYGNGLQAPTPKKGSARAPNTHAINFAAFESYLQDQAQRLGYTGGFGGIDEAIQKQQQRVNAAEQAWKNTPSPDTWKAYNQELTTLNNLKRQKAAMAGMQPPPQMQNPPPVNVNVNAPANAPYIPATNAEGESKRRRSARLSAVTSMEAEEAQQALAGRKRGKRSGTTKGKGKKKKGGRTTKGKGKKRYAMEQQDNSVAVPMEQDTHEDEDEEEDEEEGDEAWENYSVHSESEAQAAAPKRGRKGKGKGKGKGKTTKGKKGRKKTTGKGKSKGKKKKTTGKGKRGRGASRK